MKFRVIVLLIFCTCTIFSVSLKIGVYHNPPLIDFMDGKVSGLYSEIIQEIANANNWQVEYVYGEFSQLLDNLQAGKIDLMTAVAFTEERAKIIDYNRESVILNWGVACSKKQIDSFLDLDNKIIAVVEKDVYADYLERQAGDFNFQLRFFVVEDYEEALKAVKDGLADIAIVSRIFAAKNAKRYSLKISGVVFSPVELRFAFPKGAQQNHILTQQIDNYLSSLKSDSSRYNTLIARYLGTYVEEKVIPRWLSTILILSIFGVALLALWIISLRKIVQRRTQQLEKIVSDLDKKNEELTSANEEIRAQDQEIRAINEELEKTLEDLEISIQRFARSMNLFNRLVTDTENEQFYQDILEILNSILPDCSTAVVSENTCYLQTSTGTKHILNVDFFSANDGRFDGIPKEFEFPELGKVSETLCLTANEKLLLLLFNHSERKLSEEFLKLVEAAASALKAFITIRNYENEQQRMHQRVIDVLLSALSYHEPYTAEHSSRAQKYAVKIAEYLNLEGERIAKVYWASLIHDIGKLAIPREILRKPSKLSPHEYELVKKHPVVAAELLEKAGLSDIAKIVRHHHERYDGSGYPDGLKGEQIPVESKIISVVDAFDAMTSDRPYRPRLSKEDAIKEIKMNSGTQFDPVVVNVFLKIMEQEIDKNSKE